MIDERRCPEQRLLLHCARTTMDAPTAQHARAVCEHRLDWHHFLELARHHKVFPLIARSLNTHCGDVVPDQIIERVRHDVSVIIKNNLYLTARLIDLQQHFCDQDIRALSYKGPLLALTAYGDLAHRQFGDLDILVSEQEFSHATRLLREQGYVLVKQYHWESRYVDPSNSVFVDLHKALLPRSLPISSNFEDFWNRRAAVSVGHSSLMTFAPCDMLLILCLNTAKDALSNNRLASICDIGEAFDRLEERERPLLLARARRLRSSRPLRFGLCLAKELLGTGYPDVLSGRADRKTEELASFVSDRFFDPDCETNDDFRPLLFDKRLLVTFRLSEFLAPQEADQAFLRLPTSLSCLYWLLRPIRVLAARIRGFFSW